MAKKKKNKSIVPLSPEKYIRYKSRSLPIGECWVNEDWNETGLAELFVTRKHSNGNISVGVFLVDIYCLGVKYTFYRFNIPPDDLSEMLDTFDIDFVLIDYPLAHNIIYGAIEYADQYGFEPKKDFDKITQYILEEDEDVELIDLEFGYKGKPYLIIKDDNEPYLKYKSILDKTVGPDGYKYLFPYEEEFEEEEDEEFPEYYDFIIPTTFDDDTEEKLERFFNNMVNELDMEDKPLPIDKSDIPLPDDEIVEEAAMRLTELTFMKQFSDSEVEEAWNFGKAFFDDVEIFEDADKEEEELRGFSEIDIESYEDALEFVEQEKYKKALQILDELNGKYSFNPRLLATTIMCLDLMKKKKKVRDLVIYSFQKFPDYLPIRTQYLMYLMDVKSSEEIESFLKNNLILKDIYTDRRSFPKSWVAEYYQLVFIYFINTNQLLKAKALLYHLEVNDACFEGQLDMLQAVMFDAINILVQNTVMDSD